MYERLEKEAKEREKLELGCSVDETGVPLLDQPTSSDAKKRGLSEVNGDDNLVGESPPKLLKMSSASEDEMEVEGAVNLTARDFMDLNCGDVPALEMQECTYETCDRCLGAEDNVSCRSLPTNWTFYSMAAAYRVQRSCVFVFETVSLVKLGSYSLLRLCRKDHGNQKNDNL